MAVGMVRVTNICSQEVSLQIQQPGGDFYIHQKQVRLRPGKSATVPNNHLMTGQIENLKARRQISVYSVA